MVGVVLPMLGFQNWVLMFVKKILRRIWQSEFRGHAVKFWLVTAILAFLGVYECFIAAKPMWPANDWKWIGFVLVTSNAVVLVVLYFGPRDGIVVVKTKGRQPFDEQT